MFLGGEVIRGKSVCVSNNNILRSWVWTNSIKPAYEVTNSPHPSIITFRIGCFKHELCKIGICRWFNNDQIIGVLVFPKVIVRIDFSLGIIQPDKFGL